MYKNYLKIAFRNLLRNKLFSVLNILGLVVGMVASLLILQYVRFEMSYDSSYANSNNIYRIVAHQYKNGEVIDKKSDVFVKTGERMTREFPK